MVRDAYNWIIATPDIEKASELSSALGIPSLLARVLVLRGISDPISAESFLKTPLKDIHDPFLMKGMRKCVDRIILAIQNKEKILVFGDYDVDGVAAASLMIHFFNEIECPVDYYIPNRLSEGYGLNEEAMKVIRGRGVTLMITADCGISAVGETKIATDLGMDVIVTDHHQAPEVLPEAFAILNPLQSDCQYPFKFLSGAGVIYKLLIGLRSGLRDIEYPVELPNLKKHLDLVTLATIADIVPLTGENHIFARHGLEELNITKKAGLRALKSVSGLAEKKIDAYGVSFQLAPRLNAAGRMGEAKRGVNLLTSISMEESMKLASELEKENNERREVQEKVICEAKEMIKKEVNLNTEYTIVLASENWHPGVIGIAASKIVDFFNRPTVLIAVENGVGKGSARSIEPFDIYSGLKECSDILREFGGHKAAAGIRIDSKDIPVFRNKFARIVSESLRPEDLTPTLKADDEILINDLDTGLVRQLESLAPFGMSNPSPAFVARDVKASGGLIKMGKNGDHIKFRIESNRGIRMEAVGFYMERTFRNVDITKSTMDILFSPQINEWNGRQTLQLKLHDCRIHGVAQP